MSKQVMLAVGMVAEVRYFRDLPSTSRDIKTEITFGSGTKVVMPCGLTHEQESKLWDDSQLVLVGHFE